MNLGIWEKDILKGAPDRPARSVESVSVTVKEEETGNVASLFADEDGDTALSNPITFNDKTVKFYARDDRTYRVDLQTGSLSRSLRNQSVNARKEIPVLLSEQVLAAATQITLDQYVTDYTIPIKSDTGEGEVIANSALFGDLAGFNTRYITLIGVSDTDYMRLESNAVDYGLLLNGVFEGKASRIIRLFVDHSIKRIVEVTRNI